MMIWYFGQPPKGVEVNLSLDLLDFLFWVSAQIPYRTIDQNYDHCETPLSLVAAVTLVTTSIWL